MVLVLPQSALLAHQLLARLAHVANHFAVTIALGLVPCGRGLVGITVRELGQVIVRRCCRSSRRSRGSIGRRSACVQADRRSNWRDVVQRNDAVLLIECGADVKMCTVLTKDVITVQAPTRRRLIAATAVVSIECGNATGAGASGTGQRRRTGTERRTQQWIVDSHSHKRTRVAHLRKVTEMVMEVVVMRLLLIRSIRKDSNRV